MVTTRLLSSGSFEIFRVLQDTVSSRWPYEDPLAFEQSIVWLHPLAGLDFVRTAVLRRARNRRGPVVSRAPVLVLGYSRLASDAPRDPVTGGYLRRMFYLLEQDTQLNMNQFPPDARDPRTILPGVEGAPPSVAEWDRGYPRHMSRTVLGLPIDPATAPVMAS